MSQPAVLVVQQPYGVDPDAYTNYKRHRCTCCCCTCCKIHIACIVIMVFEAIGVALCLKQASSVLQTREILMETEKAWMVGLQGTNVAVEIFMIIGIAAASYAIYSVSPRFVLVHIAAQGVQMAYGIAAILVTGIKIFLAKEQILDAAENDLAKLQNENMMNGSGSLFKDLQIHQFTRTVRVESNKMVIGFLLAVMAIVVCFLAWFIYLFLKLKRYLEDKQVKIPGTYQRQIE